MTSQRSIPKGKEEVDNFIATIQTHRQRRFREKRTLNPKLIHKKLERRPGQEIYSQKRCKTRKPTQRKTAFLLVACGIAISFAHCFLLQNSTQSS
jgi:hypothetical protein